VTTKRNNVTDLPAEHEAVLSLRLTREQHARLKEIAAVEQRTVSQQVRFAVQASIAEFDARKEAA
jgi:predicted DNA-binding protein